MLLVSMAFVQAASAQEVLTVDDSPSEWEQGLIDALNSNTKYLSTDDVIANYCEVNKANISKNGFENKDIGSDKKDSSFRTYYLKDGSEITFTNESFFFITSMTEEPNNETESLSTTATTKSVPLQYTPLITASMTAYDMYGLKMYSVYSQGSYGYSVYPATVEAYHKDSWYTRGTGSIWQVSNWEKGGYDYPNEPKSEIYGRGNFHWGIEYGVIGLIIQDQYVTVKSTCDQFGNTHCTHVVIEC